MTAWASFAVLVAAASLLLGRTLAVIDQDAARLRAGSSVRSPGGRRPALPVGVRELVRALPIVGALAGWVIAAVPGAMVGAGAGLVVPRMWDRRLDGVRHALLEDQLADAVSSLSAGMRAGLSLTRAVRFAADEADEPLCSSLGGVADRVDLGEPLGEAVVEWAASTGSADARLIAGVLDLHRRTGGELPVVLDQAAATLRERRTIAREVRALTAQARLSGAILGLLPIGFFGFLSLIARSDISAAFHTPAGLAAVILGLVLQGLAFLWIRSLLRVEP